MSEQTRETLDAALQQLCQRASRDPRLHQLCLEHAEVALREAGIQLPDGITGVRFVSPGEVAVMLPPLRVEGELTGEDLDAVAGGGQYQWQVVDGNYQWVWVPGDASPVPVIPSHINPPTPIVPCQVQTSIIP